MVNRPSVSWLTSSEKRSSQVKWMLPSPQVEPIFQVTTGRSLLPPATALALAASIMPLSAALPQPDRPSVAAPIAPQSRLAINLLTFIFISLLALFPRGVIPSNIYRNASPSGVIEQR